MKTLTRAFTRTLLGGSGLSGSIASRTEFVLVLAVLSAPGLMVAIDLLALAE